MRRGLWFVAGAGAGVYAVLKARRAAEALTPEGLRDRASGLAVGARLFRDEVAQGRHEKETELRERLGLPSHGQSRPELEAPAGGRHRADVVPGSTAQSAPNGSDRALPAGHAVRSTEEGPH